MKCVLEGEKGSEDAGIKSCVGESDGVDRYEVDREDVSSDEKPNECIADPLKLDEEEKNRDAVGSEK